MARPRVGVRQAEWHDHGRFPRNKVRLVFDPHTDTVYIELEAQHDGQNVVSTVSCPRVVFSERVRNIGGLL